MMTLRSETMACQKNFRNICHYNSKLAIFSETASTGMQMNAVRLIYLMASEISREIQTSRHIKAPPLETRMYLTLLYIQAPFQEGPGKGSLTAKGKDRDLMRSEGSKVT